METFCIVGLQTNDLRSRPRRIQEISVNAAAKRLKHRDQWIGWTRPQRDRRLSLAVNNSRFLLLPDGSVRNLGSRVLRLTLDRLAGAREGALLVGHLRPLSCERQRARGWAAD